MDDIDIKETYVSHRFAYDLTERVRREKGPKVSGMDDIDINEKYVSHYKVVNGPTKKVQREKGLQVSGFGKKRGLEKGAKGFFIGIKNGNGYYCHSLEEIADDLTRWQETDRKAGIDTTYSIVPHHHLGKRVTKIAPLSCPDGEKMPVKIEYKPLSPKERAYLQQRLD